MLARYAMGQYEIMNTSVSLSLWDLPVDNRKKLGFCVPYKIGTDKMFLTQLAVFRSFSMHEGGKPCVHIVLATQNSCAIYGMYVVQLSA